MSCARVYLNSPRYCVSLHEASKTLHGSFTLATAAYCCNSCPFSFETFSKLPVSARSRVTFESMDRWVRVSGINSSLPECFFFLPSEKSGALKISFDRTPLMANWGIRGKIDSEFCSAKIFPVKSLSKVTRVERSRPTFKYYRLESDKRDP